MKKGYKATFALVIVLTSMLYVYCQAGEEKVPIVDKNGQKIMVNNFLPNGTRGTLISNDNMDIDYNDYVTIATGKQAPSFHISVGGRNLKEVQKHQKEAESYLLKALGIDQKDACRLRPQISAPKSMTGRYDYSMEHEFSFCPNGKLIGREKY